ncbi:hypothetical protein BDR03DRAFT_632954 [Suillus americanus]|nr:hypothetical protein BDR03DRAFT_632954 [Suillus americanus]
MLTFSLLGSHKKYTACHDGIEGEDAIHDLKESTGKEACFLQLNLESLKSVKASATGRLTPLFRGEPVLHILFNNAGVMAPLEMLTDDGYDCSLAQMSLATSTSRKLLCLHF